MIGDNQAFSASRVFVGDWKKGFWRAGQVALRRGQRGPNNGATAPQKTRNTQKSSETADLEVAKYKPTVYAQQIHSISKKLGIRENPGRIKSFAGESEEKKE